MTVIFRILIHTPISWISSRQVRYIRIGYFHSFVRRTEMILKLALAIDMKPTSTETEVVTRIQHPWTFLRILLVLIDYTYGQNHRTNRWKGGRSVKFSKRDSYYPKTCWASKVMNNSSSIGFRHPTPTPSSAIRVYQLKPQNPCNSKSMPRLW